MTEKKKDEEPGAWFWLFAVIFILLFLTERCTPHRYPWNGARKPAAVECKEP